MARIDSWIWAVRLFKTRSAAANACRGGHVKVNGTTVKPSHIVVEGDEVRVRTGEGDRLVDVVIPHSKRVGAPSARMAYRDRTPKPPEEEVLSRQGVRDRGAGRPSKRERRELIAWRGQ